MELKILAINCTLKPGNKPSSTEKLLGQVLDEFAKHGATGETVRAANYNIKAGVTSNEGEDDDWPSLRKQLLSADILVLGTPISLGHPSSLAQRVMERMDAFLGETDDKGRMPSFGKLAVAAIVGNEDGAHNCCAQIFQGLDDVGFTIPSCGATYWVGEAMGDKDYVDLKSVPEKTAKATGLMASNAAHLARLLKSSTYPGTR